MLNMENAEEVMQILERFTRLKQKEIPKELDDYMHYVAKTGDTVFKWSSLKYLFREKLLNVIKNFHDTSPRVDDIPQYPNVDPFNYESMKSSLLERLELFNAAPFTVQRLCELLTEPRKQYSRIDKFMRALEKNILVSTIEPGRKRTESENGDSLDSVVNGDVSLDVNVDIDMENEVIFTAEPPNNATSSNPSSLPSSNLTHKSDDDILPNPKKPKLDLEETDAAETEAATKSITSNTTDSADSAVEKAMTEETSEIVENKKDDDKPAAEENHEEKPVAGNKTTTAATTESQQEIKDAEIEKMEEDSPAPASVENKKTDQTTEVANKTEEKEEAAVITPPAIEEAVKLPCTDAAKPVENPEKEEKIDDEPEGKKKDCVEEVPEKQDTKKVIDDDAKIIKEDISDKETSQNGDNKENEDKTEINITAANKVNVDKPSEPTKKETNATCSGEKLEENSSDTKVEVTVAAVVDGESKEETKTLKSDGEPCTDTKEPTKIDEGKSSPEEVVIAPITTTSAPLEEIPATKNSADPVDKEAVVEQQPPIIKTASPPTESIEAPTELKDKEIECETEKIAELTESTAAVAESSDSAVVPVVIEPVVASDQPMDQIPESIAEAEPMVPAIIVEAAPPVEEVVMGDSIEMATDAIEPTKDEPAGMEVDDTSQEAMDQ